MRFKKGEIDFYKKHTPKELEDMYNDIPEKQEAILKFVETYDYNFVKETWKKI